MRTFDHFKPSTIRKLASERPTLRWATPKYLVDEILPLVDKRNIDVIEAGDSYAYPEFTISPFALFHNVPNVGYHIWFENGQKAIYATDTNSLDGITAPGYDLYLIESNYAEKEILERIRQKQDSGEHIYEWAVLNNHLSHEKAIDWLYANMTQNSQYVLLHQHQER